MGVTRDGSSEEGDSTFYCLGAKEISEEEHLRTLGERQSPGTAWLRRNGKR